MTAPVNVLSERAIPQGGWRTSFSCKVAMETGITVTFGDLLDQDVEAIVNPWNCNLLPWWLLVPHGVAGALRARGGSEPFRELRRAGWLRAGAAAVTNAGSLPFRGIIHVAGLNLIWCSSESIIRRCVRNALTLAAQHSYRSIAFPLIGAGVGGLKPDTSVTTPCVSQIQQGSTRARVLRSSAELSRPR